MSEITERLTTAIADRYRIERHLGQGGMATVYLAEDVRHKRKVALKVLRPELAAVIGAERFLHEITVTANLQHPNILALYDSGEADSFLYYVMPYVEGDTLRDRLEREKQLAVDDAVEITRSIASALDYAHRHNVVHRDIKPENILIHDGQALVADFGIALAVSEAGGSRLTETGLSLGTPHYMSPEQAMGDREIDARSDVYSLGAMLYEMLTGEPPYTGATAQAIVARVITEEPRPLTLQRRTVPEHVAASVHKALSKLPADRFTSAAEFADALARPGAVPVTVAAEVRSAAGRRGIPSAVALGAVAVIAAGVGLFLGRGLAPPETPPVSRFVLPIEEGDLTFAFSPAVSPDGSHFAYHEANSRLMIRARDQLRSTPLPGGEDAWTPFFSPDGQSLGFFAGFPGALMTIPVAGGSPTVLVPDSAHGHGGSWSDDGWLYYTAAGGAGLAIMRVGEGGGEPEIVARPDSARDELFLLWPNVLPNGKTIIATLWRRRGAPDVVAIDVASGTWRVLTNGVRGIYTPTGYFLVIRGDGTVHAARFDVGSAELQGRLMQVLDGVAVGYQGRTGFGLSTGGTLLYQTALPASQVVRVARSGAVELLDDRWMGTFGGLDLSPGGDRLAIAAVGADARTELWVRDLRSGTLTRLEFSGTGSYRPSWTPDGRAVLFTSDRDGQPALYRIMADGSAPAEVMMSDPLSIDEGHVSADGRWLIYRRGSGGGRDVFAQSLVGDTTPIPVATTEFDEFAPELSPDGRWIAYSSLQSGERPEVYVRPFPNVSAGRWQISTGGGTEPRWAHAGGELFYRSGNQELVAVRLAGAEQLRVVSEQTLFSVRDFIPDDRHHHYTVAPDDQAFLFARIVPGPASRLVVVQNWFQELESMVGK